MPFTGKATYSAGSTLPEIAEDVSDLIAIASPRETPLLDALGDPARAAHSTVHEWLEDGTLPDQDALVSSGPATLLVVEHATRFRVGDQIRFESASEIALVTAVDKDNDQLTVVRGYGGTPQASPSPGTVIHILGNAALEGGDADEPRFTTRIRLSNYTQIFSATVEVSGSELAVRQIGVRDELDYQKSLRARELLRSLENSVINGTAAASNPQGGSSVRRTMRGIISYVQSNRFVVGEDGFPDDATLTETQLNLALRTIWQRGNGAVDLVLVGGPEKRAINGFVSSSRRFAGSTEIFKDLVSAYESDYGVCRIVLSRHVPTGTVLLLDSSRVEVLPLAGRSFHFKPLARTGDRESGQVVGEYTLELRNEACHGIISGFTNLAS
jgi:hypothetical protein